MHQPGSAEQAINRMAAHGVVVENQLSALGICFLGSVDYGYRASYARPRFFKFDPSQTELWAESGKLSYLTFGGIGFGYLSRQVVSAGLGRVS